MSTLLQRSAVSLGLIGALGFAALQVRASSISTPVVSSIAPAVPEPKTQAQTLTITGREFMPRLTLMIRTPEGGSLEYKGDAILAPQGTSFQVAAVLATAGKYSLVVTNTDGGTSAPFAFETRMTPRTPAPVIERVQPESITKSPAPQTLTVQGQRFEPGLTPVVTDPLGAPVADPVVRDVTATSFKLSIRLEAAGTYTLMVTSPNGVPSNTLPVIVK